MNMENFMNWLINEKGLKENTAKSTMSRVGRIQKGYDLDREYDADGLECVMAIFEKAITDAKEGLVPNINITIDGDYITGLGSLKRALSLYKEYKTSGAVSGNKNECRSVKIEEEKPLVSTHSNVVGDEKSTRAKSNQGKKIDINEFIGKFDENAACSYCDIDKLHRGSTISDSINYVQYNNHIYFLVYKDQIERVKPHTLQMDTDLIREVYCWGVEWLRTGTPESEAAFKDLYEKLLHWYSTTCSLNEYKQVLKKIVTDLFGELDEIANKLSLNNPNLSISEKLKNFVSEEALEKSYKKAYETECEKLKYTYVVFGSINLSDYKVEILKEYRSRLWAGKKYDMYFKLADYEKPVMTVSNNKLWYITYMQDDVDVYGDDCGNLAVKCLDIMTKEESVVMELPKVEEACIPIVMGNILAYLSKGKLVCHNLSTGKVSKKACEKILGYNSSYVFFTERDGNTEIIYKYILDVNTGEITKMSKFIKEQLGIKEKIEGVYYIDCKNKYIYSFISRKEKTTYSTEEKCYKAYIDIDKNNVEIIGNKISEDDYKFMTHVDGRYHNAAFDGSLYVSFWRSSSCVVDISDCPEQGGSYFVRVDKDGSKHYTQCFYGDELNTLIPLGDGNLIARLDSYKISLYHNGIWRTIFDPN